MADKDGYRRYLDAAAVLGHVTRARAEELVREMMGGTDVPRGQAQQWVEEIVERGKKATEDLVDLVRSEVSNQLEALGLDADDLARQAADILRRSAKAGRRVVVDAQRATTRGPQPPSPSKPPAATKPAVNKASAPGDKRTPAAAPSANAAKKVPAKKVPAKNAPAKNAPAKKAAAKRPTPAKAATQSTTAKAGSPRSPRASRS